jgi:TRAP-type C4-dicarboxylate transport system permease small subunit
MVLKIFAFLEKINMSLLAAEKVAVVFCFGCMVCAGFGQVIARNFFHVGIIWVEEMVKLSVLWIAFIGASLTTEYARHLRVDLLVQILSVKKKRVLDVICNLFIVIVCYTFLVASIRHIQYQQESTVQLLVALNALGIKDWVVGLVIPYFFAVATFRGILHLKRALRREKMVELSI